MYYSFGVGYALVVLDVLYSILVTGKPFVVVEENVWVLGVEIVLTVVFIMISIWMIWLIVCGVEK